MEVSVIGAGSWGTALALLLERNAHRVRLWARSREQAHAMNRQRENERYLPGAPLPPTIQVTADLALALDGAELILVSVPSHAFAQTLQALRDGDAPIVWATKGFEPQTGRLLHEVAAEVLGIDTSLGVLSGPSFAKEVARDLPGAVTVAAHTLELAECFAEAFRSDRFRVYASDDIVGVQIGGGVKNVLALAAGIADGLGFGANTRAALITRGLAELARLGLAMGARRETLVGLSGLGDLVLTCTDDQSRNRRAGLILGKGGSIESAQSEIGQVVEGMTAAREVMRMAVHHGIEMPICEQVEQVIYHGRPPAQAVEALLRRTPGVE